MCGRVEVGAPAGVDDERSHSRAGSQQARHLTPVQQERAHRPTLRRRFCALRQERPVGHANAREVEHRTEVKRQADRV